MSNIVQDGQELPNGGTSPTSYHTWCILSMDTASCVRHVEYRSGWTRTSEWWYFPNIISYM